MEKILHKDVLTEAFRKVKKNKGCAGIDKVSIKVFEENLDENIELILNELRTKTYKPNVIKLRNDGFEGNTKNVLLFSYYRTRSYSSNNSSFLFYLEVISYH